MDILDEIGGVLPKVALSLYYMQTKPFLNKTNKNFLYYTLFALQITLNTAGGSNLLFLSVQINTPYFPLYLEPIMVVNH